MSGASALLAAAVHRPALSPARESIVTAPATPIGERDLAERAATLSLEQKVRLLTGADF